MYKQRWSAARVAGRGQYSTVKNGTRMRYGTCFVNSARYQARSGPARAYSYDAVAGANPWPLDARIRNHGF